jgi:glycosyltransferase involved in cell wall biosynthesis
MSSKPIKLLVIPSWYPPDGGYFFKEHCEALVQAGCEVDVMVNRVVGIRKIIKMKQGEWGRFIVRHEDGLRVIRSIYYKIPGNERLNINRWVKSTLRLFGRYYKRFGRPDLMLVHSVTWAGPGAAKIHSRYGIPYLIAEHRSFFVRSTEVARKMVKPFYIPFFGQAYYGCEKLILVSESMKGGLLELLPGLESRITIIPNMVNGEYFKFPDEVRKEDPFVFITAGRLAEVKGLDILISAFKTLIEQTNRQVLLKILGRGEIRAKLEQQVSRAGLQDRVFFPGRVTRDRVVCEMQDANCYILASRYEAFGVVLIEAMATGLPVISTRSGGPEYIVDESCGYLVEPDNVEAMTEAMLKMMSEYDRFNQEEIRERTLQYYGSQVITEKYINIFKGIMGKPREEEI